MSGAAGPRRRHPHLPRRRLDGSHGHSTPVWILLLTAALTGAWTPLQAARPGSPNPPPAASPAQADSARADSASLPSPRGALLRSAVLPGWGQLYNHRPLKAAFSAAASATLLAATLSEQRSLADATTPAQHEHRAARRNTRLLLYAVSVTFSALDAYVDAHLATFAAEEPSQLQTPAAPHAGLCLRLRLR
ncbi:MAG: DUF5683 domain-containing protein [Candidatus Latescibacterota bacterium]